MKWARKLGADWRKSKQDKDELQYKLPVIMVAALVAAGTTYLFDAEKGKVSFIVVAREGTSLPDAANAFLTRSYRTDWEIPGL